MLLDTGADVSLIKLHCLKDETLIDDTVKLNLQGIHNKTITTIGQTTLTLRFQNLVKEFKFHVVPEEFRIRTDGVIGRNLLVHLKANIDYSERILRVGLNKVQLCTPMISLSPQTETVAQVIVNRNGAGLIEETIIQPGVYIPNTIVEGKQNKASVILVNTNNHEVNISNIHCQMTNVEVNQTQRTNDKVPDYLQVGHLTKEEKSVIYSVCNEYRDIFYLPGDKLTSTKSIAHEIPLLQNAGPVHVKPYRIPFAQKEEVDRQVNKMLNDEIIRPSSSPFNAPILLVPKKLDNSGKQKWRLAVDLRRLNDVTIGDRFPLPNITEILDHLGNSRYYTALDLAAGYHQIPVKEEDKPKTAFSTSDAHYEFNRMPFGAKGAPAVFQRLMNTVLSGLIGKTCLVYLDDIIIYSSTLEEHEINLRQIFGRLRQHRLLLQPDKCNFIMQEIKFLGHVISRNGVTMDPEKISAVVKYPIPTTPKEVKSFLGLIGYYRRFIPKFAEIAKPLNSLLRKDVPFTWSKEQDNAVDTLKTIITTEPVLQYPDFERGDFVLTTDASKIALGAILSQGRIGEDKPIAYASRTLNKAESNYTTTEQELLAIVWATKHFRPYLYGRRFKIVTDHKPLKWLMSVKDPGSRLMRWRLKLEEFDYEIVYKAGKYNVNADALSRVEIKQVQESSGEMEKKQPRPAEGTPLRMKLYKDKYDNYRHWIDRKEDQRALLKEYHDNPLGGHQGHMRTLAALKLKYYWPKMKEDVIEYINTCVSCNQRKTSREDGKPAPLQISFTPNGPWQNIAMDVVGPLPLTQSGNKYLLTFQDTFTKYPEAVAIPDQKVHTVAKTFVNTIICRFGCPKTITTDLGSNFTSEMFSEICNLLAIRAIRTTAYHPQANGVIERSHRTLMNYLSHYVNKRNDDWDEWINLALMAYRATPHTSTGYTPYYLMHGSEANLPTEVITGNLQQELSEDDYIQQLVKNLSEAFKITKTKIEALKHKSKQYYDTKTKPKTFKTGELVLLFDPTVKRGRSKKLKRPWIGPYKVLEQLTNVNYKIKKGRREYITHVNRLKPFRMRALD